MDPPIATAARSGGGSSRARRGVTRLVPGWLRGWWKEERRSRRGRPLPRASVAAGGLALAGLLALDGWIRLGALQAEHAARLRESMAILRATSSGIERTTLDWAHWDNLYAWFAGQNPSFSRTDLETTPLFDGGGTFLFFEPDGRPRLSFSRRGYDHPHDRALMGCVQSNLKQHRIGLGALHLLCKDSRGTPYVGTVTAISNSAMNAPPVGALAMLEPLIKPVFGTAYNDPLRWLLIRLRDVPPATATQPGGTGQPITVPLLGPAIHGENASVLALAQETYQPRVARGVFRDLLLSLAFLASLLLVRALMLMERRRQLLIRRRIERGGERRIRQASRDLDKLLERMGQASVAPEGEEGVMARLIAAGATAAPAPLLAAAPLEQKLERLASRFQHFLERARSLALLDPLTQLPNRRYFIEEMQRRLEQCQRSDERLAILFVDVDKFKNINDSYGHAVGDAALVLVADHLRRRTPAHDFLGRYGGDEFAILINLNQLAGRGERDPKAELMAFARSLTAPFSTAVELEGMAVELSISVGITVIDPTDPDGQAAMRRSDIAMYRAKQTNSSPIAFFDGGDNDSHLDSYRLFGDLRQAIRERSFAVVFQPIVNRAGEIEAVEALARWHHPERGAVPPDVFLDLAERYRQMDPLSDQLIALSLQSFRPLAEGCSELRLSLNMPPSKLADPQLVKQLDRELAAHGLRAERITIEVTERSVLQTNARVTDNLAALRQRGVRISLDDFGTGHSSLSLLNTLQPDEVKIDRSFVLAMEHDRYSRQIVTLVSDMAQRMGLRVVAEGVENQEMLDHLLALGVSHFQGFHFARPLPPEQLLQQWRGGALTAGAAVIGENGG